MQGSQFSAYYGLWTWWPVGRSIILTSQAVLMEIEMLIDLLLEGSNCKESCSRKRIIEFNMNDRDRIKVHFSGVPHKMQKTELQNERTSSWLQEFLI